MTIRAADTQGRCWVPKTCQVPAEREAGPWEELAPIEMGRVLSPHSSLLRGVVGSHRLLLLGQFRAAGSPHCIFTGVEVDCLRCQIWKPTVHVAIGTYVRTGILVPIFSESR